MPAIVPTELETKAAAEDRQLELLRSTLRQVFGADERLADLYLRSLADASPEERILALHDDPVDIAAALADAAGVTEGQLKKYDALVQGIDEQRPRRRERVGTDSPVPVAGLDLVLKQFGYKRLRSPEDSPFLMWSATRAAQEGSPKVVTISKPYHEVPGHPEPVFDRNEVVDMIVMLASSMGAEPPFPIAARGDPDSLKRGHDD